MYPHALNVKIVLFEELRLQEEGPGAGDLAMGTASGVLGVHFNGESLFLA